MREEGERGDDANTTFLLHVGAPYASPDKKSNIVTHVRTGVRPSYRLQARVTSPCLLAHRHKKKSSDDRAAVPPCSTHYYTYIVLTLSTTLSYHPIHYIALHMYVHCNAAICYGLIKIHSYIRS